MLAQAEINWGVGTLLIVLVVGAIAIASRSFTAPRRLDESLSSRLHRVRAAIEGEHVVPALVDMMGRVIRELPRGALDDSENLAGHVRSGLQTVEVIPELRRLTDLGRDYADTDRLYGTLETAERYRGWAAVAFVITLLTPGAEAMLIKIDVPDPLVWISAPFLVVSAVLIVVAWIAATRIGNRLARLCRKYEHA
jgi:hypothetical protein